MTFQTGMSPYSGGGYGYGQGGYMGGTRTTRMDHLQSELYQTRAENGGLLKGGIGGGVAGAAAGAGAGVFLAPFTFGTSIVVGGILGGIVGAVGGAIGGRELAGYTATNRDATDDGVLNGSPMFNNMRPQYG